MIAFYLAMLETEEEKDTFTGIYEKYRYTCLHVAKLVTKNHAWAEEAVQNAFIEIIKNKAEIFKLSGSRLKSRIVIIVKNKAIDICRKENGLPTESLYDHDYEIASEEPDVDARLLSEEGYNHLLFCIAQLDDIYKTAFELKYFHALSDRQIASDLGISEKNAAMRIFRAKIKLREMLSREGTTNG